MSERDEAKRFIDGVKAIPVGRLIAGGLDDLLRLIPSGALKTRLFVEGARQAWTEESPKP